MGSEERKEFGVQPKPEKSITCTVLAPKKVRILKRRKKGLAGSSEIPGSLVDLLVTSRMFKNLQEPHMCVQKMNRDPDGKGLDVEFKSGSSLRNRIYSPACNFV